MITLYAFGRVHPGMMGKGRDLRAQRALEEIGLPYRVHALDYIAGELDGPEYSKLSYHAELIEPYLNLKAYAARALTRPAWQRTLNLCTERQSVSVRDIR